MENEKKHKALTAILTCVLVGALAVGIAMAGGLTSGFMSARAETTYSYTPEKGDGKTYYVSADVERGEEANGTYESPYNIQDLIGSGTAGNHTDISILQPGDTVLVMPGEYVLNSSLYVEKSGTYDNYITIINAAFGDEDTSHTYDDVTCVLNLYAQDFNGNYRGVTINSDYIYWYGIDVAGAGDNGMYIGGNYNIIENCQFYNNRDTGLQLGRAGDNYSDIKQWPSYNLIKNCTSFNNYDNETYGENADGFGAKLTIGYGNIFDGCIAYRNSDDGWDLYAKEDTGNIGCVIIYNCLAFENGYLLNTQTECNTRFNRFDTNKAEDNPNSYTTRDGDGNGFKLGGGSNEGDVKLYNCMSFNNRMHGVTDNSNPGTLQIENVTSYNNCASIDNDSTSNTFGQVKYDGGTEDDGCANIDLARWSYSYNTFANVLSVIDGNTKTASDAYRGAATNCMFMTSSGTGYSIVESVDADTKNDGGVRGETYTPASASTIFEETPALDLGISTVFDDDEKEGGGNGVVDWTEDTSLHVKLRNNSLGDGTEWTQDWSINTGDILKLKSCDDTPSAYQDGVGCDLSKKSWDEYTHYTYNVGTDYASETEAVLGTIMNMVYIPVYEDAVYQNFKAVNNILGYDIEWTSSDSSVLEITENISETVSKSTAVEIVVYRDADADKNVTLTATVAIDGKTEERKFDLTIKQDIPSIGDISIFGVDDDMELIVDQYSVLPEPSITVGNGADYNGKVLSEDLYSVEKTYMYATSATDTYSQIAGFTPSVAGVYQITIKITISDENSVAAVTEKSVTYYIYVANTGAGVEFTGSGPSLTVSKEGYEIKGDISNATGYSYVLKSDTDVENITAENIIGNADVIKEEFRATSLSLIYPDANDTGYYIYCVLTSLDGTQVSNVYKLQAEQQDISSASDFTGMISSNNSHTVYRLTTDLDFTNETYEVSSGTFQGLFNGLGHTISGISTTQRAIIPQIDGGTIENIKFDNITINYSDATSSGTSTSAGLIGYMRGGYLYNIAITNLTVKSNGERVGGLVGDIGVSSGGNYEDTYIQLVSIDNTFTHYIDREEILDGDGAGTNTYQSVVKYTGNVISGDERVGGLVGFIQAGGTDSWNRVHISDCFVNAYITASSGVAGGIIGRSDDRNANDLVEVQGCYVTGVLESTDSGKSYLGGVMGQFTGTGVVRIDGCVSLFEIWFNNESISVSLKNASWIIGNFAANGDILVTNCFGVHEEYNAEYGVKDSLAYVNKSSWESNSPLNMQYWEYVYSESSNQLAAPYIRLAYQS